MSLLGRFFNKPEEKVLKARIEKPKQVISPPEGRKSTPDLPDVWTELDNNTKILNTEKYLELIPLIRRSYPFLQNLSLAIHDMVQLTNTGHQIYFDAGTDAKLVKKMRDELITAGKSWVPGGAGLDSLVNKLITQVYIGGAISTEWVPANNLDGIEFIGFIKPETIEVEMDERGRVAFYQRPKNTSMLATTGELKNVSIKLNPSTFKYVALPTDTDDPRGIPPLVSALEDLGIQREMMKNIRFIVSQVGILGFIELLMDKPPQNKDENTPAYEKRLTTLLRKAKDNILKGTKDGVLVGYEGDHTYNFHSTTANISGLDTVYGLNQKMVANGLKYSGSFMGTLDSTDTNIGIVFTKMLSQLKNIQLLLKSVLEFGYTLHLLLKGYDVKNLTVEFNPSTITDDLKIQQSREIKVRNNRVLYADGIISLQDYAEDMGFEKPDQANPRAPIDPNGTIAKEQARKDREKKKDTSDRRGREKKNPQPPRKDNDPKPV